MHDLSTVIFAGVSLVSSSDCNRFRRTSPLRSFQFGDYKLTYIPDGLVQMHPLLWFAESSDADWSNRGEYLDAEGYLVGSIGGLLVERGSRALLIDSGYGQHSVSAENSASAIGRLRGGDLIRGLRQIGKDPAAVEAVALTHFHDDHIGWACASDSSGLIFRNAAIVVSRTEWKSSGQMRAPAMVSERAVLAADGQEIFPGVTVWLTPGHTAGHAAYVISADDARLIAFGDVMHTPVQVARPDWHSVFDVDHDTAVRTRRAVIAALAEPGAIGYGVHFADAQFGRVVDDDATQVWEPVDDLAR